MKKGDVEEAEDTAEVTPVVEEVTPPSAEEQLATLQSQYKELQVKQEQAEKGLNTAQATLTRKDKEYKAQADLTSRVSGIEDSIQILAGMVSKGELTPEDAQTYKKEFENLKATRDRESKEVALKSQDDVYIQQAQELLLKVSNAGYPEGSVTYETILSDLQDRKYKLAEAKFKEIKPVKAESKEETEKKWIEEGRRRAKEESGELNTSTSLPSGAGNRSFTKAQIADMPMKEYIENKAVIDDAALGGRIK